MTDLKEKEKQAVQSWLQDASKPSLENLSYALRHPETWPKGFHWDYTRCESCAMGLAHGLWSMFPNWDTSDIYGDNKILKSDVAREFAMPYEEVVYIFFGKAGSYPSKKKDTGHLWWRKTTYFTRMGDVTPEMVADEIDAYIALQ